jgi:hypothetical protein
MYVAISIIALLVLIIAYGIYTDGWGSGNYFDPEGPVFDPDEDTSREDVPGQGEV